MILRGNPRGIGNVYGFTVLFTVAIPEIAIDSAIAELLPYKASVNSVPLAIRLP